MPRQNNYNRLWLTMFNDYLLVDFLNIIKIFINDNQSNIFHWYYNYVMVHLPPLPPLLRLFICAPRTSRWLVPFLQSMICPSTKWPATPSVIPQILAALSGYSIARLIAKVPRMTSHNCGESLLLTVGLPGTGAGGVFSDTGGGRKSIIRTA